MGMNESMYKNAVEEANAKAENDLYLSFFETLVGDEKSVYERLVESGWEPQEAHQMIVENRVDEKYDGPFEPKPVARFQVTDMSSANWVLKQIALAQAEINEITAMCDTEINSIRKRQEQILKPLINKVNFFNAAYGLQLEDWASSELAGQKTKSKKLIYGAIGFRKSPDKVVLDVDEDKAIEELKLLGQYDLIRVKEEINKSALKKKLEEQNTPTYIAHIEPGENTFYIKAEVPE